MRAGCHPCAGDTDPEHNTYAAPATAVNITKLCSIAEASPAGFDQQAITGWLNQLQGPVQGE
jgi:hypothetical protein